MMKDDRVAHARLVRHAELVKIANRNGVLGLTAFILLLASLPSILLQGYQWYTPYITKAIQWIALAIWFYKPISAQPLPVAKWGKQIFDPPFTQEGMNRLVRLICILAAVKVYLENYLA